MDLHCNSKIIATFVSLVTGGRTLYPRHDCVFKCLILQKISINVGRYGDPVLRVHWLRSYNVWKKLEFHLALGTSYQLLLIMGKSYLVLSRIKGLFTWKWGTPERWGEVRYRTCTSPIRGKEILVFACNTRVTGWGPKCNHLVGKHAYKQRTIICSDEAAFRFNVVVAGKTIVWFSWLAWLSNSTPKLLPALSISSVLWRFWRWNRRNKSPCSRDLITPVRRVTPLCSFHMGKTHPTEAGYQDKLTG